jgi:PITH domain
LTFTDVGRFINRDDVDFSIASDLPATATITTIGPTYVGQQSEVPEYPVKRVYFNNVRNITLYIEDNYGDGDEDVSRLWYLGFKGEWTDLKDTPVVAVYEVRYHIPHLEPFVFGRC